MKQEAKGKGKMEAFIGALSSNLKKNLSHVFQAQKGKGGKGDKPTKAPSTKVDYGKKICGNVEEDI